MLGRSAAMATSGTTLTAKKKKYLIQSSHATKFTQTKTNRSLIIKPIENLIRFRPAGMNPTETIPIQPMRLHSSLTNGKRQIENRKL
jgi:hypothetical protein